MVILYPAKDVLSHCVSELMVLLQKHQGCLFKNADSRPHLRATEPDLGERFMPDPEICILKNVSVDSGIVKAENP